MLREVFNEAFKNAGFNACIRKNTCNKGSPTYTIKVECKRSRVYEKTIHPETSKSSKQRRSTTQRPLCSCDTCPFRFNLYYHKVFSRFFIPKRTCQGSMSHFGHRPLPSEHVPDLLSRVNPKDIAEAVEHLNHSVPITAIQQLLMSRKKANLTKRQLYHLQMLQVRGKVSNYSSASPAELLLRNLEADSEILYKAYTVSRLTGSGLVRFRKKRRCRKRGTQVDEELSSPPQALVEYGELLVDALSLSQNQEVLLCVSWTTKAGRRYFRVSSTLPIRPTRRCPSPLRPTWRALHLDALHMAALHMITHHCA